jgi:hypothetical protein
MASVSTLDGQPGERSGQSMSSRYLTLIHPINRISLLTALLTLAGCTSVPRETVESITAREPVLLSATSTFGLIYGDGKNPAVTWSDRGTLLLTPTSLYFVSGSNRALSYAMVTGTSVRTLPDMLALMRGQERRSLLTIEVSRPVCENACVFNLVDNPDLAIKALEIIEAGRARVDPFGRIGGPQPVWLAAGIRNSRYWWDQTPAYLERHDPERKRAFDDWLCGQLDCRGRGRSAAVHGEGMREVLTASHLDGYQFRILPGVALNYRAELDIERLVTVLAEEDPDVDALLVSDLTAILVRERVSAGYEVSVELTIRTFVDYFDLEPLKDGHYFWHEYRETRPLDEWLTTDLTDTLKVAARETACRVLTELQSSGGAPAGACGD